MQNMMPVNYEWHFQNYRKHEPLHFWLNNGNKVIKSGNSLILHNMHKMELNLNRAQTIQLVGINEAFEIGI